MNGVADDVKGGKHASVGKAGKTAQVVITGAQIAPVSMPQTGVKYLTDVKWATSWGRLNPKGKSAFQHIVESEAKRHKPN